MKQNPGIELKFFNLQPRTKKVKLHKRESNVQDIQLTEFQP